MRASSAAFGLAAIAAAILLSAPAAQAACPAGTVEVGTPTITYDADGTEVIHRNCQESSEEAYCRNLAAITAHIAPAIRGLRQVSPNAKAWQHDMDQWIENGESARQEARVKALTTGIELIADNEKEELMEKVELNENALHQVDSLYSAGYGNIPLAFRTQLKSEISSMRTRADLWQIVQQLNLTAERTYTTAKPMSEGRTLEGFGQFTVGVLKEALMFMKDVHPLSKATVAAVDMGFDAINGWTAYLVAKHRVDQFVGLSDQQLNAVRALSHVYTEGINARTAAEKDWRAQHNGTLPVCHR